MPQQSRYGTGNRALVRQMNLSVIMHHLRESAPVSRAALAEMTGLNKTTVSSLVQELIIAVIRTDFAAEITWRHLESTRRAMGQSAIIDRTLALLLQATELDCSANGQIAGARSELGRGCHLAGVRREPQLHLSNGQRKSLVRGWSENALELPRTMKWTSNMRSQWQALRGYSVVNLLPALDVRPSLRWDDPVPQKGDKC